MLADCGGFPFFCFCRGSGVSRASEESAGSWRNGLDGVLGEVETMGDVCTR